MRGNVFSLSRAAGTAILGSSLLLEWGLYARATIDSPNRAPWDASLPAHIAQNGHIWPTWLSILLMVITVAQVTILYSLGSGQKKPMSPLSTSFTCVVTVVVAIAALRTSYLTSNDVYAYIGYAKLQTVRDAYVPPNTNLPPRSR